MSSSYFYYGFNPVSQSRAGAIDRIIIGNLISTEPNIRLRVAGRGYNGIEPHGLSRWVHPLAGRREDDFSTDAFMMALAAGPRPDVIIAHTDLTEPNFLTALMNAKRGNGKLLLYYDPQFLPSVQASFAVKMALGMADVVYVPSDIVHKFVDELLNADMGENDKIPSIRRMPYIVTHRVGSMSTSKRMEFRGNLKFDDDDFVVGFFVENSMFYNIPVMLKAMASVVHGHSICNACGSPVFPGGQLVNDCCGDETNLSAITGGNPHVKFVIFADDLLKWHSEEKYTSIPGLISGMPELANAGISVLRGSWDAEIRSDAYNLCDIAVSLSSDIRPDLFAFEAMATGTKVISPARRSGEWYNLTPDVMIRNSRFETTVFGESWPVPDVAALIESVLVSYDEWIANGRKKVFSKDPRALNTAMEFNELLNPSIPDIEIVNADGSSKAQKPKKLITQL